MKTIERLFAVWRFFERFLGRGAIAAQPPRDGRAKCPFAGAFTARGDRPLPPGPRRLPLVGNLLDFDLDSLNDLGAHAERYGPIFSLELGSRLVVVLASAEAIHEVCVTRGDACAARPHFLNTDAISGGGQSTLLGSGPAWVARRRLLTRAFLQPGHVAELAPLVEQEIRIALDRLLERTDHRRRPVDVRLFEDLLREARFGVMARLLTASSWAHGDAFGPVREAIEAESRHFGPQLADFIPAIRPFTRYTKLRPLTAQIRRFRNALGRIVRDREQTLRRGAPPVAVLDRLLVERQRMRRDAPDVDRHCGDEALPYMLYNLFGTMNPTHITVMWAVWLLLHHPAALASTRAEIDKVLGAGAASRTAVDLDRLPYLGAVVQETMRFQPPTPSLVPRVATEEIVTSQGYWIPRGAIIMANISAATHDASFWGDPREFRPERFLEAPPADARGRGIDSYNVPFGVGPRACPARRLGTAIVKLWLVHLLESFELELPDTKEPPSGTAGAAAATRPAYIFNAMPKDFTVRLTPRTGAAG